MTLKPPLATALSRITAGIAAAVSVDAFTAALGVSLALAPCFDAHAGEASSWDGDTRAAVRLVAGGAGDEPRRAGVELRLADGWKTYWRYPGDSGVPPVFDFSKSDNIRSASVLWPAPHRFAYEGGASIGYKGDVIFPVHVVPDDPGRPATLRLVFDYAVCEKICIPEHGQAELTFPSAPTPYEGQLAAAEMRAPKPAKLGETVTVGEKAGESRAAASLLGIAAVRLESAPGHPRVVVEIAAPAGAPVDLFAEGPTADWALPLPEPVPGAPAGRRWFAFDLDGMPPGVDGKGAPLRFTLVSGENAVEVTAVPK